MHRAAQSLLLTHLVLPGLLLALSLLVGCADRRDGVVPPAQTSQSLLLVGDTGQPASNDRQGIRLRVGAGMAAEDRRLPVSRIVLLGDNFYPTGLLESEYQARVAENVVAPFCHFVRLAPDAPAELGAACDVPAAERHPVPIDAVLGNHDYLAPDAGALQRDAMPGVLPDWRVPPGMIHLEELEGGLSVVYVDSHKLFHKPDERMPFLVRALRATRGRFRMIVSHHPPATLDPEGSDAAWMDAGTAGVRDALARAGEPVHLWVSGHEHNLQLIAGGRHEPTVIAVAGAGSDPRKPRTRRPVVFGAQAPGFARVDLSGSGEARALVVTLFEVDAEGKPVGRAQARIAQNGSLLGTTP